MKLHKQAHTVYKTQYHIVWVTRFRRKWLVKGIDAYLYIVGSAGARINIAKFLNLV